MSDRRKSPVIPLAIAAVALVALIGTAVGSLGADSPDPSAGSEAAGSTSGDGAGSGKAPDKTWETLVRRTPDDPMARGELDAPVVMIAYSEFQCPFCGKFARDTEPELVEKYVEDGTLRIEWRDFPYLGPESRTAAEAGRAAAAQGRFWEFHEAMYEDQLPPNSGKLDTSYVAGIAEDLGLDVQRFREDMGSKATSQAIERDFAEGQAIGVTGTPAFVINGVPVIGAQPTSVFEDAIEQAARDSS